MGGGKKRGRTQRRHFKHNRDNVWRHDPKKPAATAPNAAADPDAAADPNAAAEAANPSWEPFATQNPGFEEYYKEQGIVPEDEWEEFICVLRKPLPAAFRINASGQFFQDVQSQLENDFAKSLESEVIDEDEAEAIRPLPWYPGNLAWHLNFSRMQLRRNQVLERFHEFLKQENEVGNITRQEAVSMVPPLFLDVLPHHHILDMCAAPGSKTFQLLEMIHQSIQPGFLPDALVIANDVDVQRCNLLIHQTKRMFTANLIVTNHEAQHFPGCSLMKGRAQTSKDEELAKDKLQFDRVLCDVPCSGDGTLRKAPDMWRKWNAGMGNGLHRLQVEIAMRGVALLKVGGRMVYSTCSMNPVENEAVVAEVLRRSEGSVELLDVSGELPELVRRPGLSTWKVRDRGSWLPSYEAVPLYRRNAILLSMFPSGQSCKERYTISEIKKMDVTTVNSEIGEEKMDKVDGDQDHGMVGHEPASHPTTGEAAQTACTLDEGSIGRPPEVLDVEPHEPQVSGFPLHRCMRILPHDQNSGAFFIAVFQKSSPLHAFPENHPDEFSKDHNEVTASTDDNLDGEFEPEISLSDVAVVDSNADVQTEQPKTNMNNENACCEEKNSDEVEKFDDVKNDQAGMKDRKRKLQIQGKWRGVDPVVFFKDEMTINSIMSFYGIDESFPLNGRLVTRNTDANHVKRIYYISKTVHHMLQLNFQVGQRLKITSVGLKIFERQASKDGSTCAFRLSSEGLPLLLPYLSKQILYASLADFQHLLQYRVIKFADFVEAKFGENASALMPGCCVVVLREGNRDTDSIVVGTSTVAIVCWKGKTNLSIMVSPLDAKELLERLRIRYKTSETLPDRNMDHRIENGADDCDGVTSADRDEADEKEIVP